MPSPALRRALLGAPLVLAISAFTAQATRAPFTAAAPQGFEVIHYDVPGPGGTLTGGAILAAEGPAPGSLPTIQAPVTTLFRGGGVSPLRGTGDNRLDLVFVGDGYTASELGDFQAHVDDVVAGLFGTEPLGRYSELFAVHRVDVVSNESGVDNDPSQGIDRDTALDMAYWCNGIERLLCVNVGLAGQYASNAPAVDQIVALANSTKYGGAGYLNSNLATSAGANGSALEIVKHELGHSLGNLADEYTYGGPPTYAGGEPSRRNVSTYDAQTMAALGAKWSDWLGASAPGFDGTIGTIEGAMYSSAGIYRPSQNSLMRSLGRPFNLVGAEQIIEELYREVSPIDAASDPNATYTDADVLFVDAVVVGGAPLPVTWSLDGVPVATGPTLDLGTLGLGGCGATVTATVRDDTTWMRNEPFRDAYMTETRSYAVNAVWTTPACPPTPNSVSALGAELNVTGSPSIAAQSLRIDAFSGPPSAPILFFYGDAQIQVPYGQGTICVGGNLQRLAIRFFDPLGVAAYVVDWQNDPVGLPGTALAAGSTWHFQGWFRDVEPGGAQSFDFTGSVAVTFCP